LQQFLLRIEETGSMIVTIFFYFLQADFFCI